MTNLTILLEPTEKSEHLRKLIVDKVEPSFKKKLPKAVAVKAEKFLDKLNNKQKQAVFKAIAAEDYLLIKGMPGTGKTATIIALIELLIELKQTILITSHTHSAVDNVCLRLKQKGIDLLRLGSEARIHPELKNFSEQTATENCDTPEELEQIYDKAVRFRFYYYYFTIFFTLTERFGGDLFRLRASTLIETCFGCLHRRRKYTNLATVGVSFFSCSEEIYSFRRSRTTAAHRKKSASAVSLVMFLQI